MNIHYKISWKLNIFSIKEDRAKREEIAYLQIINLQFI